MVLYVVCFGRVSCPIPSIFGVSRRLFKMLIELKNFKNLWCWVKLVTSFYCNGLERIGEISFWIIRDGIGGKLWWKLSHLIGGVGEGSSSCHLAATRCPICNFLLWPCGTILNRILFKIPQSTETATPLRHLAAVSFLLICNPGCFSRPFFRFLSYSLLLASYFARQAHVDRRHSNPIVWWFLRAVN